MSRLQQQTSESAIDVWQEYQDYLARFESSELRARPLTLSEFQGALDRWQREYHPAWSNNDKAKMHELEQLLALS